MAYDGRRPPESGLFAAVFSRSSRHPLGAASECSVFQGVFDRVSSADTAGRWCPSCNPGSQASTPWLVPVGASCVLEVPGGVVWWGCPVGQTRTGQRLKDRRPPLLFYLDLNGNVSELPWHTQSPTWFWRSLLSALHVGGRTYEREKGERGKKEKQEEEEKCAGEKRKKEEREKV